MFNKTVADELNLTMSGMSHASEFIALVVENRWRVAEEPVEILYTDYSMSKGQPLLNGVNIVFDGLLRGRLSPMNWIQVLLIAVDRRAAGVPVAVADERAHQGVGQGRLVCCS